MANFLTELLVSIIRVIVVDLLWQAMAKFCAWLDPMLGGRTKTIVGLSLGLAAFFFFPIIVGLLS
jgi:hypothetical protein